MSQEQYWLPDFVSPTPRNQIRDADEQEQASILRKWFLWNYADPVDLCPYESKDGGYLYIWGGPYDAEEELFREFGDIVSEDIIGKVVRDVESHGCLEWSRNPDAREDAYLLDSIQANSQFHQTFSKSMENIEAMLEAKVGENLLQMLNGLLYVNVITAMETYLSDAFINTTLGDLELVRRLVESNPDFTHRNLRVTDIFQRFNRITDEVKAYLLEIIYHKLEKVSLMYKTTLEVAFPRDLGDIYRAIEKRHDIVHRSAYAKDGTTLSLNKADVKKLIEGVSAFINEIDRQIAQHPWKKV